MLTKQLKLIFCFIREFRVDKSIYGGYNKKDDKNVVPTISY